MNILMAVPAQDQATGNWITARRFAAGLEARGHRVRFCSPPFEQEPKDPWTELVILFHAFRTGYPWYCWEGRPRVPSLVFLAGTDLNQGLQDPEQTPQIEAVMRQAGALVHQNPILTRELRQRYPGLAAVILDLPAGTVLGSADYDLHQIHGISRELSLFLCPASIRPVKAVLGLLHLFDSLARRPEPFHLAFCGPCLDGDYAEAFLQEIDQRPWASWLGTIAPEAMPAALRQADVILNNSESEALSNALVEAASLGRPMLARDIPGNALIVEPGGNGFLYQDAESFLQAATQLLCRPGLRARLSRPRPERFSPEVEAEALEVICLRFMAGIGAGCAPSSGLNAGISLGDGL